jgi:hypothetical protein
MRHGSISLVRPALDSTPIEQGAGVEGHDQETDARFARLPIARAQEPERSARGSEEDDPVERTTRLDRRRTPVVAAFGAMMIALGACSVRAPQPVAVHPAELSADAAYLARLCKDGPSGRSSERAMIDRSCKEQKKETSAQYLARMCEDTAEDVRGGGEFEWEEWNCEQLNPELGRKLKAEHEKFLADHPIQHYGSSGAYPTAPGSPDLFPEPSNPFAEAEKAQRQFYHDEQIRSDQELLDWPEERYEPRTTPASIPSSETYAPVSQPSTSPLPETYAPVSRPSVPPPPPVTWGETPYAPMIPPVMRDQPVENINPLIPPAARGLP